MADIDKEYTEDYDYAGYEDKYGKPDQSKGQHLTDEFKLPNHITFSTDSRYHNEATPGGEWSQDDKGKWHYAPSDFVLALHPPEELQKYFKEREPDSVLDLPKSKTDLRGVLKGILGRVQPMLPTPENINNYVSLPPEDRRRIAASSAASTLAPAIMKEELMPIITKPLAGQGTENVLRKIMDLFPESGYKKVKNVAVKPASEIPKGEYGSFNPTTENIEVMQPGAGHSQAEYIDTVLHELLHNATRPLKMGTKTAEEVVGDLARRYVDYGVGQPVHPSITAFQESIKNPPSNYEALKELLKKIY